MLWGQILGPICLMSDHIQHINQLCQLWRGDDFYAATFPPTLHQLGQLCWGMVVIVNGVHLMTAILVGTFLHTILLVILTTRANCFKTEKKTEQSTAETT